MENLMQQVWVVPQSKKEVGEETCFVRFHLVPRVGVGHPCGSRPPRQTSAYKAPSPLGQAVVVVAVFQM